MHDFVVYAMLMGAISSGDGLPFWMSTNQYGLMPQSGGAVAMVQVRTQYDTSKDFQYRWGLSLAANTDPKVILDECYGSFKWKVISLDLGMKHRESLFMASDPTLGSLSVTGGHFMDSGNSRAMPGYSLVLNPWAIPGTKEHLVLYGLFGDYLTLDDRYVRRAMVHRTQLMAELAIGRFEFHIGLDHYATWNGVSASGGQMPNTFGDYLRVISVMNGGSSSSQSDRYNVIGNQLGAELLKFVWKEKNWKITFQHEIPYEDKSGMKFHNFPDGNNTFHFGFTDKDRWVSDIVYEFNYTMCQSGAIHDPEFDEEGNPIPWRPGLHFDGMDDYFNNGEYCSGWTYYGRTIGCPLFFPKGTLAGTWEQGEMTLGVENNRLVSHHIGLSGKFFRHHPYRLMLTYSKNYGRYSAPYVEDSAPLRQFSFGLSGKIADVFKVSGLGITYGLYGDKGQVLQDKAGASVGLSFIF